MDRKNENLEKIVILAIISVIFFYFFAVTPCSTVVRQLFGSTNLPAMVFSITFFLILMLILRNVEIKLSKNAVILFFIVSTLFLLTSYAFEKDVFDAATHIGIDLRTPRYVYIPCVILFVILLYAGFGNTELKVAIRSAESSKLFSLFTIVTGIALALLSAYHQYRINFTAQYDRYHLHSYIQNIINLFWKQPYTETISGIYGHYAFFYIPSLRLLKSFGIHNYYNAYLLIISVLTVFTLLIWFLILKWNVKSNITRILLMLVISSPDTARLVGIYPMIYPHREFLIALTTLLIALWFRSQRKTTVSVLGYLLCSVMIIWNTECGIFSIISWSSLHCCHAIQRNGLEQWKKVLLHCLMIPGALFLAVFLSGLLNVSCGGEMISIKDFFAPIMNAPAKWEASLAEFPAAWMSIMVLFLIILGHGMQNTVLLGKPSLNDQTAVCFSLSVLGMGSVTYAINRPAYGNFYIIFPSATLFIGIISEYFSKERDNILSLKASKQSSIQLFKGFSSATAFAILCILAFSTFINIPYKLEQHQHYKNTKAVEDLVNAIEDINDPEALAIGEGASLLFFYMGRDPGIYYYDTANIFRFPKAEEEFVEKLRRIYDKSVFISNDSVNYLPKEFLATHDVSNEMESGAIAIQYYVPDYYDLGTLLSFTMENSNGMKAVIDGFSDTEIWGTWMTGKESNLMFQMNDRKDMLLSMTYRTIASDQHIKIYANDYLLQDYTYQGNETRDFLIPAEYISENGILNIHFDHPDAITPKALGINDDIRELSLGIISMSITDPDTAAAQDNT